MIAKPSRDDDAGSTSTFGVKPTWEPVAPRLRPLRLLIAWMISAAAVWVAAAIVPGAHLDGYGAAFAVAAVIAVINALLPPVIAALRLPWTLAFGFLAVLLADALATARRHSPSAASATVASANAENVV